MKQELDNLWSKTKKGALFLGLPLLVAGTAGCTLERKITNHNYYDPVYDAPAHQRTITMQPVQEPLPENTAVYGDYETIDDVMYDEDGTAYDMPSQTKSAVIIDQEPESADVINNNFYFNRSTNPWRIVFENSVYPSSYGWDIDGDGIIGAFDEWPYRYGPIVDMNGNGTPDWSDLDVSGQFYYDYWANHIMYSDFFYGSPSISAWWSWSLFNRHTRHWGHHHHNYWYNDPWHNNYYGSWGYSGHNSYWHPPKSSANKYNRHLPHRSNLGYAIRPRPADNSSVTPRTATREGTTRTSDPRYRTRDGRTSPANAQEQTRTQRESAIRSASPTARQRTNIETTRKPSNAVRTTRAIGETNRNAVTQKATTQQRQRENYSPTYTKPKTQTRSQYNRAQQTQQYRQPAVQPKASQRQQRSTYQQQPARTNTRPSTSYTRPSSTSKSSAIRSRPSQSSRSSATFSRPSSTSRSSSSYAPSRSSSPSRSSGSSVSRSSGSSGSSVSRSSGSSGSRSSGGSSSRSSSGSSRR